MITEEPEFTETIENVTVPAGNELPLTIDYFAPDNDSITPQTLFQEGMLNWRVL